MVRNQLSAEEHMSRNQFDTEVTMNTWKYASV